MKKGDLRNKNGFTIIEVLLVLAIAGLIFLMIFIAWPALNRTQRDSKRKDDISVLLKKVKDYQTNNRGALPSGRGNDITYQASIPDNKKFTWLAFYHDYLGDQFQDPNGWPYSFDVVDCGSTSGTLGSECSGTDTINGGASFPTNMKIVVQASCNGEKAVAATNPRKVAVQYKLEGGGIYCANT